MHAYIRKCTYMYIICNLHLSTRGGLQMRCGAGICTFVLVKQVNFCTWGGAPDGISGDVQSREVCTLVEFDGQPFDYVDCYFFSRRGGAGLTKPPPIGY